MEEAIEMEKKYLIIGEEQTSAEDAFKKMLAETRILGGIDDYLVSGYNTVKKRPYRYFDTFDTKLTDCNVLTYIGPLEQEGISMAARKREHDYVLTIKFPQGGIPEERLEFEFPIPAGTEFYELNPDDFLSWSPLKRVKQIAGGQPLQEIIRLEVETSRFDLERENEKKVQVALDVVTATMPFKNGKFYELEIEKMALGEDVDVGAIDSFFRDKYHSYLQEDPRPKWIKGRNLLRGKNP